jgi:hypothetical protein
LFCDLINKTDKGKHHSAQFDILRRSLEKYKNDNQSCRWQEATEWAMSTANHATTLHYSRHSLLLELPGSSSRIQMHSARWGWDACRRKQGCRRPVTIPHLIKIKLTTASQSSRPGHCIDQHDCFPMQLVCPRRSAPPYDIHN